MCDDPCHVSRCVKAKRVESQLKMIIRPMYSSPPLTGARIVQVTTYMVGYVWLCLAMVGYVWLCLKSSVDHRHIAQAPQAPPRNLPQSPAQSRKCSELCSPHALLTLLPGPSLHPQTLTSITLPTRLLHLCTHLSPLQCCPPGVHLHAPPNTQPLNRRCCPTRSFAPSGEPSAQRWPTGSSTCEPPSRSTWSTSGVKAMHKGCGSGAQGA